MSFKAQCTKNNFQSVGDESGAKYDSAPTIRVLSVYNVVETSAGADGTIFYRLAEIPEWSGHEMWFDAEAFRVVDEDCAVVSAEEVTAITDRVWGRVRPTIIR